MLSVLRKQIDRWLAGVPQSRPAAVRRSDEAGWLLATDLPSVTGEAELAAFCREAEAAGFRCGHARNGWLLLDAWERLPAASAPRECPDGETGAAISLLARHPGNADPAETVRQIARACERGRAALERCCASLHARWAECLRRGEALPGDALPFLCMADQLTAPGNDGNKEE